MKRRLTSILLTFVLLSGLAAPALAADTASVIRLTRTSGTVSVSKSSGKSLSLISNMRLYNGYHVNTSSASYAWLNLDDTKLLKEDASSDVAVQQSGKKLEVKVWAGSVFFDVSQKLGSDESLNISTSTMIVGIRGTSGYVQVMDRWTTRLTILEGTAVCSVSDPVTGQVKTEAVRGGETVECVVYSQEQTGDKCDILRETTATDEIPGFVLTDLARNVPLCDKILDASGLDILRDLAAEAGGDPSGRSPDGQTATPEVLGETGKREAGDRSGLQEKLDKLEQERKELEDSVSGDKALPTAPSSGGGSSGGGSTGGTTQPSVVTLTMPVTDMEVQQALNQPATRQVIVAPGGSPSALDVGISFTVDSGKTLTLNSGVSARVQGSLTVNGTLDVQGGDFENYGTITVTSGDTLRVAGNFTNRDSGKLIVTATGRVAADGALNCGGIINMDLTPGATVLGKTITSSALPGGWAVSDGPDSSGYFSLVYSRNITFDANGGTLPDTGETTMTASTGTDGKLASLPTAGRGPNTDGTAVYRFDGWFDAPEGGTQITGGTVFLKDATVYARWTITSGWDWAYEEGAKTLRISGTGAMTDFVYTGDTPTTPWCNSDIQANMTTAVIEDGITSIGDYAFVECTSLTGITIPDSVTIIGSAAFEYCTALTSITIPNSVTSIGGWAFGFCTKLASVTIPNSVTSIGDYAFEGCSALTSITLPSSVTNIGDWMFYDCSSLTSITLPDGVTGIGAQAFRDCKALISITIPDSVTDIGLWAFYGCTNLKDIYFNGTREQWEKVTKGAGAIPDGVAVHCTDDIGSFNITFNANGGSIITESDTSETIQATTGIDGKLASWPATPVRGVNFSFLGWYDADNNKVNQTAEFSEDTTLYARWEGWEYDDNTKAITIAGNGPMADYSDTNSSPWSNYSNTAKAINIENGFTSVGNYAFYNFTALTSVIIPEGVTSIGSHTFFGCTALTSVIIPEGVTSIGSHTFFGCSALTSITIPNGVTSIGDSAFEGCTNLASVTIPEDVTSIGSQAFAGCTALTSIIIPDGVTSIGDSAFNACSALTSITIPNSVTDIGERTFSKCSSLTSITIPDGVTSIGYLAFYCCDALTSVIIPEGVTSIGESAFADCDALTSITIPNGVTDIGLCAFEYCTALTSITLPSTVTSIGDFAFDNTPLRDIYFNGTREQWGEVTIETDTIPSGVTIHCTDDPPTITFNANGGLFTVDSGTSETITIATGADGRLPSLPADPDRGVSLGGPSFAGWYTQVLGGTKVELDTAFNTDTTVYAHWSGWIYDPDTTSLELIGDVPAACPISSSESWTNGIKTAVTNITVTEAASIGESAFSGCISLTNITLPAGLTSIEKSAFSGCTGLTSINIPASVTSIGEAAFSGCGNLSTVNYNGTMEAWNALVPNPLANGAGFKNGTHVICTNGSVTHG